MSGTWQGGVLRGLGRLAGRNYRPPVLVYHSISGTRTGCVPAEKFRRHVRWLAEWGVRVVPLSAVAEGAGRVVPPAAAITFDDGYADFMDQAYPLAAAQRIPVAVCVVVSFVGTPGYLSWEQLRALAKEGLVTLASHTLAHHDLSKMDDQALREDLRVSRERLQEGAGCKVEFLAYPWGKFSPRVARAAAEAGYRAGFTTNAKLPAGQEAPAAFSIRRMTVSPSDTAAHFFAKVSGLGTCAARTLGPHMRGEAHTDG